MWKKLLENYAYRGLIMEAKDFPLDVKVLEDRKYQRGEKAPDRFWTLKTWEEREQHKHQEKEETKAWLKKQEGYNPYGK